MLLGVDAGDVEPEMWFDPIAGAVAAATYEPVDIVAVDPAASDDLGAWTVRELDPVYVRG